MSSLSTVKQPVRSPSKKDGKSPPSGYQVEMYNPFKAAASVYQIAILKQVFGLNNGQIKEAIVEAHTLQKSVVFIGTREIAEMRTFQAEQMKKQYMSMSDSLKKIGFVLSPM